MTTEQVKIWKVHRHKGDFDFCPMCGTPLRWIYDGDGWMPCDREPVLFVMHPRGRERVVYQRKVYDNCVIYRKGDERFSDGAIRGNVQHYYTCPVMRENRRAFARAQKGL